MQSYKRFGVMLDVSRNAVLKLEALKEYMTYLAKMGYDTVELYAEDMYEVDDEPYLGYLRGRYTKEELKDVVAHAATLGIEVIPCIQTLAHFTNTKRLPAYAGMWDTADILMVGEERTYEFIEHIFKSVAECFTSREINIGMDEAFALGLGAYREKHGLVNRFDILTSHLTRVCKIAEKYGFTPHMWSDMFYRIATGGKYYTTDDVHIPEEVRRAVPENIGLAYWDYYHTEKTFYDKMIEGHLAFDREVWFAGGALTWRGMIPQNEFALRISLPAMRSVREHGIKNVLITMWGDDGGECSFWSSLPALYAIRQYALGNEDETAIKAGFEKLFGIPFDAMMLLDLPNRIPARPDPSDEASAKAILYADPMFGIHDAEVEYVGRIPYNEYADKLAVYQNDERFGYLFAFEAALCRTLAYKYDVGNRARSAYLAGDRAALRAVAQDYSPMMAALEETYNRFRNLWYRENKAFGFEVQDLRYGGLLLRMENCQRRIYDYLDGKIARLEEFEEKILPFHPEKHCFHNRNHVFTCTTSNVGPF